MTKLEDLLNEVADDVATVGLRAAKQVADRGPGRWAVIVVVAEMTDDEPIVVTATNISSGKEDIALVLDEAVRAIKEIG